MSPLMMENRLRMAATSSEKIRLKYSHQNKIRFSKVLKLLSIPAILISVLVP